MHDSCLLPCAELEKFSTGIGSLRGNLFSRGDGFWGLFFGILLNKFSKFVFLGGRISFRLSDPPSLDLPMPSYLWIRPRVLEIHLVVEILSRFFLKFGWLRFHAMTDGLKSLWTWVELTITLWNCPLDSLKVCLLYFTLSHVT